MKKITGIFIMSVLAIVLSLGGPATGKQVTQKDGTKSTTEINPAAIMQTLMLPAGSPIDKCLLPQKKPVPNECLKLLNVDRALLPLFQESEQPDQEDRQE